VDKLKDEESRVHSTLLEYGRYTHGTDLALITMQKIIIAKE
jgi:hypothetical protein